jgi:hypothetical protein
MRILLSAAIIALLFDSVGSAQSLADVASAERARRQRSATEGAIYTTEQIQGRYEPPVAAPQDPESLDSLEDLRDSLLEFGANVAEPTAGLLEAGTDGAGVVVEMLESFEAGLLEEIQRLDTELANPSISDEERSAPESELLDAQQGLSEVPSALGPERLQLSELQAGAQQLEATQSEIEDSGILPAAQSSAEDEAAELTAWWPAVAQQRGLVQNLEDNEVRRLLEITSLRGRVTAPTGSQQERNQAQAELANAEMQLIDIRGELAEARSELQILEADIPVQL